MSFEKKIFAESGPSMPIVDRIDPDRRKLILAACLVEGVYGIEYDRRKTNRKWPLECTKEWWEKFHFKVFAKLEDDKKHVFGCIYELTFHDSAQDAPNYVIAFRGTIFKSKEDHKLNLKSIWFELDKHSRIQKAMDAANDLILKNGTSKNIWLAGHSLGSLLALLLGKSMAREGFNIETYLFNPPFLSLSELCEGRIHSEVLKYFIHGVQSLVRAGVASIVPGQKDRENQFISISNWKPYLFVNPNDYICSGYIEYFRSRNKMENTRFGEIERIATQNSVRNCIKNAFGKKSEPIHLLPSARLYINKRDTHQASSSSTQPCFIIQEYLKFKQAHGIHQWWDLDFSIELKEYLFN